MLYFTKGYVSSARGGVFNELFQDQKHKLSSFQYTDATRASGYAMTKNLVATDPDIDFIYACATDIALGAIDALEDMGRQDIQVNGWGGGDAELKAIEQNKLTATVMRSNDDTGIAMAEVIKSDIEGQATPRVFSGKLKLITFSDNPTTIKRLKEQAFRYSKLE
jgi:autoinducer 2-binding protein LuxP